MLAGGRPAGSLRLSPAPAQSELDQPGLRSCDVHLGNLGLVSCPLTRRQTSTPQHLNSQTETETNTGTGIVLRRIQDCGCQAVTVTVSHPLISAANSSCILF